MENELEKYHKKTGMFLLGKNLLLKKDLIIKRNKKPEKEIPQKTLLENIPKNATHIINGHFYKIGSHGYTFIFVNNNWQRCNDLILTSRNKI
jgi:hypothetical protein